MKEKTKQDLKFTGEMTLWVLFGFIILGMVFGIAYLMVNFHWAFIFLIIPIMIGVIYLLIRATGVNEIGEC